VKVSLRLSRIRKTSAKEWAVRFLFGGLITMLTGVITYFSGPVIGGLFLAFPAILPASVTLVKKHSGQQAAGWDAAGAVLGSIGMLAFGAVVWTLAARAPAWVVLAIALAVWLIVSAGLWLLHDRVRARQRRQLAKAHAGQELTPGKGAHRQAG
jgi:hypothetical protein